MRGKTGVTSAAAGTIDQHRRSRAGSIGADWKLGVFGGIAGVALLAAVPAAAQSVPTREEILREADRPIGRETAPEIDVEDGIERAPCPLAAPEFADVKFVLRSVEFSNSGPIDVGTLMPAYADRIGSEVPVAAICDIRDRAAEILRRDGYLAAVRVPVQTIDNGVVRLDILAARLVGVQVRGDAGNNEGQLARYLAKLENQPLFNSHDAERYLLLAGGIPGMSARLTLRPGGAPGDVVGEVTVDRTPAFFDANIQNYNSRSVGRFGGIARVRVNGLTGLGDETTLGVYSSADFEEQQVVQGAHEFRIGGEGLTIGTDVTYAWTSPSLPDNLPIESRTFVWSSHARYPVTLRQSHALWLGGGFDWIDQDVELAALPLNRDHLRVVWLRADANWIDPASFTGRGGYSPYEPKWSASLMVEARQGIGGLGASRDCRSNPATCLAPGRIPVSRIEADTSAFVLRATAELAVRPTPLFTIAALPRAQYAPKPLLTYEEFSAGTFTIGRGYDPGTITGESGVGAALEARYGSLSPRDNRSFAFQPYAFFDAAWVWNEDSAFDGLGPDKLYSAGGGLRVVYGNIARLDLTVAEPLRRTDLQTSRGDTRFLVSLTAQFGAGN